MKCSCECTTQKREFVVVVTVQRVNAKKDIITFLHHGVERTGLYSAWVGAKKRILKKGDRIRIHVCDWGHEIWNPAWSCDGEASIWRLVEKGEEILKRGEVNGDGH